MKTRNKLSEIQLKKSKDGHNVSKNGLSNTKNGLNKSKNRLNKSGNGNMESEKSQTTVERHGAGD